MEAIKWENGKLLLIDQRVLPFENKTFECSTVNDVWYAIKEMVVRGAPAIGVTAAYGLVIAIKNDPETFLPSCKKLFDARPTAVNLHDAIEYMKAAVGANPTLETAEDAAIRYHRDDLKKNIEIGKLGAAFLSGNRRILTHCNAGALATSGWGTALGIIRELHAQGRLIEVIADETRPFLQGARLTVWECLEDKLPVKMCTDGMGAYLMSTRKIDAVIVGADRIAANGDTANKIGTCMLAIAANHFNIPFIVAAPTTTLDLNCPSGGHIPIEQRPAREVTHIRDQIIVPEGTQVYNPAFDVTTSDLITAIITENGVFQRPYKFN